MRKRVMLVFGTRPEAIKMGPLVRVLKERDEDFETMVCVTGQHREMLDQVLQAFGVVPDFDLSVMEEGQTLFDVTARILAGMRKVFLKARPEVVLVHGDTTTTFATALAAYYLQIPVGHVEAGLRTGDIYSPFPEEFSRQGVGLIAAWHFAPTQRARENLLREGKDPGSIFVTGNTAIDALQSTVRKDYEHEILDWARGHRLILITAHRRENLGEPMAEMFRAIRRVLEEFPDVRAVYPLHKNPQVRAIAHEIFGEMPGLLFTEPLEVLDFHNILSRSYLVLTDSGGIQEEAPSLGIPVLVMREVTERPEGVEAGTLRLVGRDQERIYQAFRELLTDEKAYQAMSHASNPYGDGKASRRIAEILKKP